MSKQTALRLYELLNQGDVDPIGDLVTADYVEHDPLPGQGEVREGDRVMVRWTNAGTHVGEFAGIPATGGTFQIAGIDVYRVEDGRLAEHWHVVDQLSMLGQLGLLPAPA